MPSVAYMNQSAPFWDFIASLEQQGFQRPQPGQNHAENEHEEPQRSQEPQDPFAPWTWGNAFFGGPWGMPHRGRFPHEHDEHHRGEPAGEKEPEVNDENDNGEGPSGTSGSDNEARGEGRRERHGRCGRGPRGRCGPGGRHGFGPRHPGPHWGPPPPPPHHDPHHGPPPPPPHGPPPHGPPHHGPHHGPPHGPPHHGGRRGGWGPWAHGSPFGGMGGGFDPSTLVAHLINQFTNSNDNAGPAGRSSANQDHTPEADIFDTESAYVIHVSLPGAKKEDVGVNWDAEKSELSVAGVIYRIGDEEFLKTLAMDERKVGAFERKIRLGTRANPANVDADGITAKLEDGVLRVEVPKLDSGYVEVRKVDIE